MANEERFKDNEDGTISDTRYNLMWTKEDSYQMRKKWCAWKGANNFTAWLNEQKFAGHEDWRLPKSQECRNLYDHDSKNSDFNGDIVHLDFKFPEGCGSNYWCQEESGINAMAYNFYSDRAYQVRKKAKDDDNMCCRAVRTAGPAVKRSGRLSSTGRTRKE